jgi:hypothetical protein
MAFAADAFTGGPCATALFATVSETNGCISAPENHMGMQQAHSWVHMALFGRKNPLIDSRICGTVLGGVQQWLLHQYMKARTKVAASMLYPRSPSCLLERKADCRKSTPR